MQWGIYALLYLTAVSADGLDYVADVDVHGHWTKHSAAPPGQAGTQDADVEASLVPEPEPEPQNLFARNHRTHTRPFVDPSDLVHEAAADLYKWFFGELPEREEVEPQYTRKHTGKPSWWPSTPEPPKPETPPREE